MCLQARSVTVLVWVVIMCQQSSRTWQACVGTPVFGLVLLSWCPARLSHGIWPGAGTADPARPAVLLDPADAQDFLVHGSEEQAALLREILQQGHSNCRIKKMKFTGE